MRVRSRGRWSGVENFIDVHRWCTHLLMITSPRLHLLATSRIDVGRFVRLIYALHWTERF